ncbi:MAG: potassium-transporting ATPase subunit F [Saprospiraceae bacterium]|nr:potassium-transporting ATPase subunit F [Saprospiraceae bacterium]
MCVTHFFLKPLIYSKKFNSMIALLFVAIAVFVYICYVLLKPDKF